MKRIMSVILAIIMVLSVLPISVLAAGEVGVTQSGNVLNAGWPAVEGATSYKVDVYKDSAVVSSVNVTTNSARYTVTAAGNYQFVVTANGTAGLVTYTSAVTAATYTGSTTGSTGTGTGTGLYVTAGTRTVYWNSVGYGATYTIYVNGMPTPYQTVNVNSFTVPAGITLVTVKYTYNGMSGTVGSVTMPATGNSTGTGNSASGSSNYFTANGITISKSTAYTVATWTADTAAAGYFVTYKNLTTNEEKTVFTAEAAIQLPFSYLDKWSISVDKFVNGIRSTIGFTTVYPTGTNTNVTGSTTTAGTNCTVISSATSSTLTWTASTGATYYKVYYIVNGQSQTTTTTTTSVVIPVGNSTDFTVLVVDSNNVTVAYASVKKAANTGSTNVGNTTTTIKNLTLTAKNSWTTTVSWDKVNGAAAYLIMYAPYGSSATQEASSLVNSCDIPFGSGSNYVVYVYALLSNGGTKMVGEATHIAGSEGSTAEPEDETKDYVTNLKGVSGESKKIKLSWDAAKDATKYTIYYKRSSNSEWIKAGTTSKCAVNLNGLTNGTKYDFKVVANGNDSGILTIAPSTTSKTVLAADPEDVETVALVPEISSATSSKSGTATIKWAKVDDATSYKVYFAEEGSNSYRSKATVSTTSCTITGLKNGTYKVRVKALVDGEWTALADCKYVSVTVK